MRNIRELGPDEEPALVRFFEANDRPQVTDLFFAFPFTAETATRICRDLRKDRYFATFLGEEIVCLGMLRGWDEGYEIPTFGMTADYRHNGRGYGWRMWRWVMGYAAQLGARKLRITTHLHNEIIIGMAQKLGFRHTKDLPGGRVEMMADLQPAAAESNE